MKRGGTHNTVRMQLILGKGSRTSEFDTGRHFLRGVHGRTRMWPERVKDGESEAMEQTAARCCDD